MFLAVEGNVQFSFWVDYIELRLKDGFFILRLEQKDMVGGILRLALLPEFKRLSLTMDVKGFSCLRDILEN